MMHFSEFVGDVDSHQRLLKVGLVEDNFDKWKRELNPRQIAMVTRAASKEMYDLGYVAQAGPTRIIGADVIVESTLRYYSYAYHVFQPVGEFIWQRSLYAIGTVGLFLKRYSPAIYYFLTGKPRP